MKFSNRQKNISREFVNNCNSLMKYLEKEILSSLIESKSFEVLFSKGSITFDGDFIIKMNKPKYNYSVKEISPDVLEDLGIYSSSLASENISKYCRLIESYFRKLIYTFQIHNVTELFKFIETLNPKNRVSIFYSLRTHRGRQIKEVKIKPIILPSGEIDLNLSYIACKEKGIGLYDKIRRMEITENIRLVDIKPFSYAYNIIDEGL